MAEWRALAQVAAAPTEATRAVARRGDTTFTHADFCAAVAAWRGTFATHGGARVALVFDDAYDFACALYGAWHAGREAVLPGDALPATLARLRDEVDAWAGDVPGALQPQASIDVPLAALDAAATRVVIHTSGSNGVPVAIAKALPQLDAEVRGLQQAFGVELTHELVLATVSQQHIYGLLFRVLWPLAAGRPFAARRCEFPEQIAVAAAEPCVLVASPAHLRRLGETIDWSAARRGVRAVFSSGGFLPLDAAADVEGLLGQAPVEIYGSSETGGVAQRRQAHDDAWQPLPGVHWRIDDGLLAVRSPHLPDDAWAVTRDRAAVQGGGFALLGRADRIVKLEEKRVSLDAIDRVLAALPEVAAVRTLLLDGEAGARVAAAVVLSDAGRATLASAGKTALNARLREAVSGAIERVVLPRHWRYVDALPADTQGKVTEARLAALFRTGLPAAHWLQRDGTEARMQLALDPMLAAFDGHFPGMPILPGVMQLDWAIAFARDCFALAPVFKRIEQLKFQRLLRPGMQVELRLQWHAERAVLAFAYSAGPTACSSGRVVFAAGGAS
jgi:acyl-coenzyme A synthetase/AMP-(fatty) acid ligase/3-hydroxymyristoyl/3-hydroxydecanoyl-(acyl carrier protein) dehydratase